MACAFHHRDSDHPPKQHSCVQPPYLSAEGAVKVRRLKMSTVRTLSFVSSPVAWHFPCREMAGGVSATIRPPVNSRRRFEDDEKASPMSHPNQRLHPRPHRVIPVLKLEAQLHRQDCCLGRCLQGGYARPYSWRGAVCMCLAFRHLLKAPKNTKDFFCRGPTAVKPRGASAAEGKGWLFFP